MRLDEPPSLPTLPAGVRIALRRLDTEAGVRLLGWVIAALMLLGFVVLVGRGGSQPADPTLEGAVPTTAPTTPAAPAGRIAGFGEARARLTTATVTRDLCVAVASSDATRRQGMMGRTDFGGYDAMVFVFQGDTTASFYMRATPLPLSIAWFDRDGRFVGTADMDPCPDKAGCPTFDPGRAYRVALEAPRGALDALGVSAGSTLVLGGSCTTA